MARCSRGALLLLLGALQVLALPGAAADGADLHGKSAGRAGARSEAACVSTADVRVGSSPRLP